MITLVVGPRRSGKSAFAEQLLRERFEFVTYVGTLPRQPDFLDRIRKHADRRPPRWSVVEVAGSLPAVAPAVVPARSEALLLDGLAVLVAYRALRARGPEGHVPPSSRVEFLTELARFLDAVVAQGIPTVVVSNDQLAVIADPDVRDLVARANALVAERAGSVHAMGAPAREPAI